MNTKLMPAMRRAMDAVRNSDPIAATRSIQQALLRSGSADIDEPKSLRIAADPSTHSRDESGKPAAGRSYRFSGLAETLAALRALKSPDNADRRHQFNSTPESPGFQRRQFARASGERDFRLFIPSISRPCGLIVMLHGCRQTAEDFAVGTNMNLLAEEHGLLVAYPFQPSSANASSCWNWFRPQDQARTGGEAGIIAGLTQSVLAEFALTTPNVFVAGLSAGGAMAAVLGSTYPEIYSAAGVHSGLAYKSAHDVNSAFAAMRGQHARHSTVTPGRHFLPRLIVFHGSEDHTVALSNASALWRDATGARGPEDILEMTASVGGRAVDRRIYSKFGEGSSVEEWIIHGSGHSWSGGNPGGSYTEPDGPNASAEMVRFFLNKPARPVPVPEALTA